MAIQSPFDSFAFTHWRVRESLHLVQHSQQCNDQRSAEMNIVPSSSWYRNSRCSLSTNDRWSVQHVCPTLFESMLSLDACPNIDFHPEEACLVCYHSNNLVLKFAIQYTIRYHVTDFLCNLLSSCDRWPRILLRSQVIEMLSSLIVDVSYLQ